MRVVSERGRLDEAEPIARRELEHHLAAADPDPERVDGALTTLDGLNAALGRIGIARLRHAAG